MKYNIIPEPMYEDWHDGFCSRIPKQKATSDIPEKSKLKSIGSTTMKLSWKERLFGEIHLNEFYIDGTTYVYKGEKGDIYNAIHR